VCFTLHSLGGYSRPSSACHRCCCSLSLLLRHQSLAEVPPTTTTTTTIYFRWWGSVERATRRAEGVRSTVTTGQAARRVFATPGAAVGAFPTTVYAKGLLRSTTSRHPVMTSLSAARLRGTPNVAGSSSDIVLHRGSNHAIFPSWSQRIRALPILTVRVVTLCSMMLSVVRPRVPLSSSAHPPVVQWPDTEARATSSYLSGLSSPL